LQGPLRRGAGDGAAGSVNERADGDSREAPAPAAPVPRWWSAYRVRSQRLKGSSKGNAQELPGGTPHQASPLSIGPSSTAPIRSSVSTARSNAALRSSASSQRRRPSRD
jgi:hypothetical protein